MKLTPTCISCLVDWARIQAKKATKSKSEQIKALRAFMNYLSDNLSPDVVPAELGTAKNSIIRKETSNPDPYKEEKKESNEIAKDMLTFAEDLAKEKIESLLKISAIANSMEFGVRGYHFDSQKFVGEMEKLFSSDLGIDDASSITSKIRKINSIFFLADNAGEIVLDSLLLKKLSSEDKELYIGVKESPVQDDVTVVEARELGIDKYGKLINVGRKVGIDLELAKSSLTLSEVFDEADLIIAKGMGNYEVLSEIEGELGGRLVYLLRAKCGPVASSFGVGKGDLVAKFIR